MLSLVESNFPNSECIPLKCELYSNLLVNAAISTCEVRKPAKPANTKLKLSKKVRHAKSLYKIKYNQWNNQNRNKNHQTYHEYVQARKALQQVRRYDGSLADIKLNNEIMRAHSNDRNRVYSLMKESRGVSTGIVTSRLETPVGTYFGKDILEGFTPDAEYFGRTEGECPKYDNHFYRMCIRGVHNTPTFVMN